MPFVNRKYYMNPLYGVAVERERLRATGAEDTEPEVESATDAQSQAGDRWVTIDHRHVLIHEGQRLRLPTHSEFVVVPRFGHEVPISSNSAPRTFGMKSRKWIVLAMYCHSRSKMETTASLCVRRSPLIRSERTCTFVIRAKAPLRIS